MMLVGFGFLMTFLAYNGFGSVGFNFLLTCYVIEWATLVNGWFKLIDSAESTIRLDIFRYKYMSLPGVVKVARYGIRRSDALNSE